MWTIDAGTRGIAMAACALVGTLALADGDTLGSPTDLEWLRAEVGDGALVHHSDGRIYLTELATAESVLVGNGNQPAKHMVYGDFAVGDGVGQGWLAP